MLRSLVLIRRLPIQLRSIHVASSVLSKHVHVQKEKKPKVNDKRLYDDIQITLPSRFLKFLNEFENKNVPSKEAIEEELYKIRSYHIRYILNVLLEKNLTHAILTLLPYLIERKLITDKNIIPVVQALTKVWIQLGSTSEIKAFAGQLIAILPETKILDDLNLLLNLCSNEWPIFGASPDQLFMLKRDCFNALVAGALRHSDFKQLTLILKNFPTFFIHSDRDLFKLFIDCIQPGDSALLSVYLDHLNGIMVTDEIFEFIKEVKNKSRVGFLKVSKVVDGSCDLCKTELTERLLSTAEFETLKSEFSNYLKDGCESNKLGSKNEFHALQKMIAKIKQRSVYGSAVVLDALNLTRGNNFTTTDFVEGVDALRKKYDLVVLIARHKLANDEKVWNLKQDGVEVFSVSRYSKDDLFSIYSAMHLGSDTILVSNDRFTDIAHDLNVDTKICKLFNIWSMNQVVTYKPPFVVREPNQYSNLLNHSYKTKTAHFIVFHETNHFSRKLICLKY